MGQTLVTVTDITDRSSVVAIAETIAASACANADISGLVIASVRPGGGVDDDDDVLWFEVADAIEGLGLTFYDWLIIGRDGCVSMVDELGMSTRWVREPDHRAPARGAT